MQDHIVTLNPISVLFHLFPSTWWPSSITSVLPLHSPYKAQSHLSCLKGIKKCSFLQWTTGIQQRNISGCVLHPQNTKPEKITSNHPNIYYSHWDLKENLRKSDFFPLGKLGLFSLSYLHVSSGFLWNTYVIIPQCDMSSTWYWIFHFYTKLCFIGHKILQLTANAIHRVIRNSAAKRNNSEQRRFLQCEL